MAAGLIWWNSWDAYSATADATNSTSRVGESVDRAALRAVGLEQVKHAHDGEYFLRVGFAGFHGAAFAYPWSAAGWASKWHVANLGSGGLVSIRTTVRAVGIFFGLDAFTNTTWRIAKRRVVFMRRQAAGAGGRRHASRHRSSG